VIAEENISVVKRLFLVRHCESTGQEASAPLTAIGQRQAGFLADHLETAGVELLVSSPYTRAQQSIVPLAQRLGLPVELDPRLVERVLSAAPLKHWREAIRQTFEDLDLAWPGGESSRTAMARGREAVNALLRRPVRVVVVVTHGNLMTLILHSFETQFGFQAWEHLSNPDVYYLEVEAERVRVTRTWVPPVASSGTSQGASAILKREEA
jgi:2,3-bisphosphoglycerate-dependent phosphoglycerate mutase